jgi:antirestriction protein ArdC
MATVYDLITERIIEKLQQGSIPWQKPRNSAAGLPRNLSSQKAYRGINVWMLGSEAVEKLLRPTVSVRCESC